MASDGNPGSIAGISAVIGSLSPSSGKSLPQSGKNTAPTAAPIPAGNPLPQSVKTQTAAAVAAATAAPAATAAAASGADSSTSAASAEAKSASVARAAPQTQVDQLNKYLNDSGRPDQFRVDPTSSNYIQQVNPATGAVIAEYSVSEFPALARSVGASGLLIDDVA